MGVVVLKLRVFGCWAFVCSLLVHGSAASPIGEGTLSNVSNSSTLIDTAPTPVTQPSGSVPPLITTPPPDYTPAPQTTRYFPSTSPSTAPENAFVPPPTPVQGSVPTTPPAPQFVVRAPEPATSPSSEQSQPPNPRQADTAPVNNAPIFTPVSNGPPPLELPEPALPSSSVSPEEPPTPSPDVHSHPSLPRNSQPIVNEPPSSPPEKNASPILAPPPTISKTPDATVPRAEPSNRNKTASVSYSPTEAPNTSNRPRDPNSAPPPRLFSKSAESHSPNAPPILAPPPTVSNTPDATVPRAAPPNRNKTAPVSYSPTEDPNTRNRPMHPNTAPPPRLFSKSAKSHSPRNSHRARVYNIAPAPEMHEVPPPSSGSSTSASPIPPKPIPFDVEYAPMPTPDSSSWQAKFPFASPKLSPSGPSPRTPKSPLSPPILALPPPPPHKGCAPMTCTDPLTYGPPQSPCSCVIPIQVGLRLSVALLTFFPLVSELASEIAYGVYMMQSQVRIMGANAAEDNPDKTVVLIDLLPIKDRFDDTTSIITFKRFWLKQVVINKSVFGDYDVLYVRYPGLPPSPPLPPSTIGMIASNPYPDRNNPRTVQPLGVDVSGKQQKRGLSGSIVAIIIISCFGAVLLLCSVAWVFLFRYGHCDSQPDPTPPATIPSLAKSSGMPVTIVGSGTSSPPFSLVSSIAAYTGSAKTFSSSEIEKATDSFNETRVIGEGGFGRVYSGVLEDGMKVAVKILKRYDQQGGREFLAEVEMLSRLHHRNLVKLIGICVDDHTRCLVYELITNGSVDSHLHGCDKERCPLDWSARLKIALGAARALAYLHEDSSPRVIHRDFKASNILLEDDFTPKVSDFGLARTGLDEENRHISTRVMGTFGYVAPEYAMTGHLLVKSDVYSYGVVLLELLTGRKPVDMSQPPGEENLVSWARPLLTSSQGLESIIDQSLISDSSSSLDNISKVAAIASMCVQPEVSHRPFMGEVVQALRLVCNECDGTKEESPSRSCSQEDFSIVMEIRDDINSGRFPGPLLSPSTFSDYDFRDDGERDLSMSELLSPTEKFGGKDSESFRRHSSSGPLRTGKGKPLWKTMRQLSRGSMSEHGVPFRLWPGSH